MLLGCRAHINMSRGNMLEDSVESFMQAVLLIQAWPPQPIATNNVKHKEHTIRTYRKQPPDVRIMAQPAPAPARIHPTPTPTISDA